MGLSLPLLVHLFLPSTHDHCRYRLKPRVHLRVSDLCETRPHHPQTHSPWRTRTTVHQPPSPHNCLGKSSLLSGCFPSPMRMWHWMFFQEAKTPFTETSLPKGKGTISKPLRGSGGFMTPQSLQHCLLLSIGGTGFLSGPSTVSPVWALSGTFKEAVALSEQESWLGKSSFLVIPIPCRVPAEIRRPPKFKVSSEWLQGFPGGSGGKESACDMGDLGSIPGLARSPGERNGNPLQYSSLENSMDRGAWQATVHGVTKSWTWLSNFHFFRMTSCLQDGGQGVGTP